MLAARTVSLHKWVCARINLCVLFKSAGTAQKCINVDYMSFATGAHMPFKRSPPESDMFWGIRRNEFRRRSSLTFGIIAFTDIA